MSTKKTTTSPLGKLLTWLAPIEPHETNAVVAAFCLFFCIFAGTGTLRPVRETIATLLTRPVVADLWLYTAAFSILIVPLYALVVARVRRSVFLPVTYGVVAAALAVVGIVLDVAAFNPLLGKMFYVFVSVLNLFLISMFWSFLLELFDRNQTKRLFSVIAAGGSTGALAGPGIADLTVKTIGQNGVLFVAAAMFVVAIVCQQVLLRIWTARTTPGESKVDERPIGGTWFAGLVTIVKSPYLLGIALFIVGISAVSTLLYFEQLRLVEINFPNVDERTQVFARFDWIVQGITLFLQVFFTGRIAARFGVTTLLTAVPIMMILGFLALASSGAFMLFAVVFILRRAGEYAFVRPAREMLWSPLDKETKYKAKSTLDVPVYRGADYVGAQANSFLGETLHVAPTGMMIVGAGVATVWGLVGWWLGKRFEGRPAAPLRQEVGGVVQGSKA